MGEEDLTPEMRLEQAEEAMAESRRRMARALEMLDGELAGLRTGRASTALVERLDVVYYDTTMPLRELATIATPEPRLITIRPWDKKAVAAVEKAILASDLGMTPSNDGQTIRLVVPRLTEERRGELSRIAGRFVEEAHVAVRNVRRDLLHGLAKLELPEDMEHGLKEKVQEMTDDFVAQADERGETKKSEIMEV